MSLNAVYLLCHGIGIGGKLILSGFSFDVVMTSAVSNSMISSSGVIYPSLSVIEAIRPDPYHL